MNGREGEQDDDGIIKSRDVDPGLGERGAARARRGWVDGDVVHRYLDDGGDLKSLVGEGTEQEVVRLFEALVYDLRVEAGEMNDEEGRKWVERWVGEVLMPVL